MATGTVKVFHTDRNFGFLTTSIGESLYVNGDQVEQGPLRSGDLVEFEVAREDGHERAATEVTIVKPAPTVNPVGRTMAPPPTWSDLQEIDRQRRQARRRRR